MGAEPRPRAAVTVECLRDVWDICVAQVIEMMLPSSFLPVDVPVGCTEWVQAREYAANPWVLLLATKQAC